MASIEDTVKILHEIQSFDTSTLVQEEDFGATLSFAPVVPHANKIVTLFQEIHPSILNDLPESLLDKLRSNGNDVLTEFKRILSGSKSEHSQAKVNASVDTLSLYYNNLFPLLSPIASYSTVKSINITERVAKSDQLLSEIKGRFDAKENKLNQLIDRTEEALDAAQKAASEQGVTQQAIFFNKEAKKYDIGVKRWFWASAVSGIALIGVIIFTFCFGDAYFASPKTLYQTIQFNISRVFLLAIFAYALFFCSKNYFSSKHNAIINHHRTNALRSYEALAKAAKDTANTDIILNHAAACVFSPQNTGFSGGKADGKLPGAGSPPYFVLKASADSDSK